MRKDYFVYNGKQYNTGTIIILKRFDCVSRRLCNTKATFLYFDPDKNEYTVKIYGTEYVYTEEKFHKIFVCIYEERKQTENMVNKTNVSHNFSDELNVDCLLIAWIWYIFIMAVGVIFYDRIGIWVFTSIMFFSYRNRKLKEAGYK